MSTRWEIEAYTLPELSTVATRLLHSLPERRTFAFSGELGAGKTTLVQEIGKQLGVATPISSPTFTLVNEYHGAGGTIIYHFDFFRLRSLKEAMEMGLPEYFSSGVYCLVEWPELVPEILPADTAWIFLSVIGSDRRKMRVECNF